MEDKIFHLKVNKQPFTVTPDNSEIAMFRERPDNDYLQIAHEDGETYTWIFNQREMLLWMGRICVQFDDERTLRLTERQNGTFREQAGFSMPVHVRDLPEPYEEELLIHMLLRDDLEHPERIIEM